MAALAGLFWRVLGDVRPRERPRFLFFAALATLIGLAQTLGFVGAEALFLAAFGAAKLPIAFVAAALTTVLGSLLYAARVGVTRNDALFVVMLLGTGALLAAATAGVVAGLVWLLPALFCFYYLTQAVFVNHLWTFTGDYFDTVASKRLLPLFTIGASVGGFLGGTGAALVVELAGPVSLIGAWAAFLLAGAVMLRLGRRNLRRWGPLELEEADETSVEGMRGAALFVRSSRLALWLVLSVLGMVLSLFVAQYLYSDIFTRRFPEPGALAAFFGVYLAITNLVEIALEVAVTPWLIRRLGVGSTNLVHPALTLLSFGALAGQYSLATGVAARANRELVENAVAGPVRALVYNALPMRFRGRMRAFLEGIVVYAGMAVAGLLLLAVPQIERVDPRWLCGAGAAAALLYLFANLRARREYLQTLVRQIRQGRYDPDVAADLGSYEAARLAELWEQMLREESGRPSASLLQLIPELARRDIHDPLVRALEHPSPDVRRACLTALAGTRSRRAEALHVRAFDDPDPGVRLAALRGVGRLAGTDGVRPPRVRRLIDDPDPHVRAEAALYSGEAGLGVLRAMIGGSRDDAVAALRVAPPALLDAALARAHDADPAVRAAALECVAQVAPQPPLPGRDLLDALRDPHPAIRRAAVLLMANHDDDKALEWLAEALSDPAPEVQFAAETVLGTQGEAAIAVVGPRLRDERERAAEAALRVVAACGAGNARELLARELRHHARELWRGVVAFQYLPADDRRASRFLRAAHEDAFMRHRRMAFRILELVEDPAVIRRVEKVLRFGRPRAQGDALEVLSNLGDRESAQLLVAMHEKEPLEDRMREVTRILRLPHNAGEVLEAARRSPSRWVRLAAHALDGPVASAEEHAMERLLALKQVPLFSQLSLEQLEAIQKITDESEYLANEVICRQGDPGGELFLLIEGRVRFYMAYGTLKERYLGNTSAISYFGEMATLDDAPRSATVVADGRCRLLTLDGASLKELILQMPEISFEIFRVLTGRIRAAERRLTED